MIGRSHQYFAPVAPVRRLGASRVRFGNGARYHGPPRTGRRARKGAATKAAPFTRQALPRALG